MTSLPKVSDEYLVEQIVQGDLHAFDSLYKRHVKSVYNRVRFAVPEPDVEDVTQEVFLAVITSLPKFRREAHFVTWLYKVTNYKVAEYHRKRYRKKETMQVDLDEAEEYPDPDAITDFEGLIDLKKEFFELMSAMETLPHSYREVILHRFVDEMQFSEIAMHMKKSIDGTKMLFRRAICMLHEVWKEYEENKQQ